MDGNEDNHVKQSKRVSGHHIYIFSYTWNLIFFKCMNVEGVLFWKRRGNSRRRKGLQEVDWGEYD
jgi:hypothetical protein